MLGEAEANFARGQQAVAIFETGRVFRNDGADGVANPMEELAVAGLLVGPFGEAGWQRNTPPLTADFALAGGIVERLCCGLGAPLPRFLPPGEAPETSKTGAGASDIRSFSRSFHPGRTAALLFDDDTVAGIVGELHPRLASQLSFRDRIYLFELDVEALRRALPPEGPSFRQLPRYQAVTRDLAPRVHERVRFAEIEEAVRKEGVDLVESCRLTDVFRGAPLPPGTKSLTLSFTFRSPERTLTEADVAPGIARIRAVLEARCGATFVG
jgi:phenylalanyl-tRNA synthetase beta chain